MSQPTSTGFEDRVFKNFIFVTKKFRYVLIKVYVVFIFRIVIFDVIIISALLLQLIPS